MPLVSPSELPPGVDLANGHDAASVDFIWNMRVEAARFVDQILKNGDAHDAAQVRMMVDTDVHSDYQAWYDAMILDDRGLPNASRSSWGDTLLIWARCARDV